MPWFISQFYAAGQSPPAVGQGFKKGANPCARNSQEPLDLLEAISPAEVASCVPFVKIEKIDRFGKPSTDIRPLMYDLVQSPQFGAAADDFGLDSDSFIERSLVSLNSVTVDFDQQYGNALHRQITMDFTVHHPAIVFSRNSRVAWREIMMEGKSFTMEYGWKADPGFVKNPLFNGEGHVTESGQVLKSTQLIMLIISSYEMHVMQNGEVKVTIHASENGDLALREMKFSDAFAISLGGGKSDPEDSENVKALRNLIGKMQKFPVKGKGEYFLMGDILDQVVAPMVVAAGKTWGYDGVDLLLGNFNKDTGPQSDKYFGSTLEGHGIEDFRVPVDILMEELQLHFSQGRAFLLQNFITLIVGIMNREDAWDGPPVGTTYQKPHILLKSETVQTDRGIRLVIIVHDINVGSHPFTRKDDGRHRIPLDRQSPDEIAKKLHQLGVPALRFAKASTLILDASFQLQPDTLLQSIQVDLAYKDRKDRVQQSKKPDVESRKGQARKGELRIPVSIVEGEVQMYGNFAMEVFGQLWIDFFGSKEISGIFSIRGKTDTIEPGVFKSSFKVISEGLDPFNTRRQRTEEELKAQEQAVADLKAQGGKKK
jgi:hypothetical protein